MARPAGRGFTVQQDQDGGSLLVALAGELDIGGVELLAACADQICGPVGGALAPASGDHLYPVRRRHNVRR